MKRIIIISTSLAAIIGIFMLQACKKEYPSKVVPLSFPVIDSMAGGQGITISRGGTFTDPGVYWHDSVTGETGVIKLTIPSASKDTAFLLTYIATNKNGLQANPVYRVVGVTNISDALDISGTYQDANGGTYNITKLSRGVFSNDNIDGFGYGDLGFFAVKSDSTLSIPPQPYNVTGALVPFTFSQVQISYATPITIQYTFTPKNVGNFSLQFVKQ